MNCVRNFTRGNGGFSFVGQPKREAAAAGGFYRWMKDHDRRDHICWIFLLDGFGRGQFEMACLRWMISIASFFLFLDVRRPIVHQVLNWWLGHSSRAAEPNELLTGTSEPDELGLRRSGVTVEALFVHGLGTNRQNQADHNQCA